MRPPWDRKRRALPKLPKGQVRVQVKVIEVGGGTAAYRRSKSFTVRDYTYKEICAAIEVILRLGADSTILGSVNNANPRSGGLTDPPAPE